MSAPARTRPNSESNKVSPEDRSVHNWYRFVLSFPPHLVNEYLRKFKVTPDGCLLDPFCGTGTTLVECKKNGIPSVGIEANEMAFFASGVKTNWDINPDQLRKETCRIASEVQRSLRLDGIGEEIHSLNLVQGREYDLQSLAPDAQAILLKNSISPIPLHKCIKIKQAMSLFSDPSCVNHLMLSLANTAVNCASNLKFGPEVGVGLIKEDAPVISQWKTTAFDIAADIELHQGINTARSQVIRGDSRSNFHDIPDQSISAVFTSPPYPNEKDYTRTTRLESALLGFVNSKQELQAMKRTLLRSNTRNVYKGDLDHGFVSQFPEIEEIALEIERRRIELGKTSGFERLYARVTKLYFGGMAQHFAEMRRVLKPGAMLGYVVGDQASYLRVMIRTGSILAMIAESLGYEVVGIDLFRTRLATVTKEQLREEVVVLRWPGQI